MTDAWQRTWTACAAAMLAILAGAGARAALGGEERFQVVGEEQLTSEIILEAALPASMVPDSPVPASIVPDSPVPDSPVPDSIVMPGPAAGVVITEDFPPSSSSCMGCTSCTSCTGANCTGCTDGCSLSPAETYWIFDAVFLQRDNQSTDQVLAAIDSVPLITTGEPQFAVQPGFRLFHGDVYECGRGWEVGYLGVWNMFADTEKAGDANIAGGDPLSYVVDGFDGRSLARATYRSSLNTAEANLLLRSCHRGFSRVSAYPWERCGNYRRGTFDWLAGFRWAGLDEAASLELSGADYPGPSFYNVRTSTNLFGAQLGGRGRMEWDRFAIEGWAKAALAGTAMSQSSDPIVSVFAPDPPVRRARSAFEGGVGFIGDINLSLAYRLSDAWRLRAGYNFLWLTGVPLAPNQFDFAATNGAGKELYGGAGVFLHGASLGLEASW